MKIKTLYMVLTGTVFLMFFSSCKMKQENLKTGIYIPNNYHQPTQQIWIDTLMPVKSSPPESWELFFTDKKLTHLMKTAMTQNFDIQIAYQNIMQSRAGVAYTKGIRLPELGTNISVGQRKFGDYTIDGVGNYDTKFSTNISEDQQIPYHVPDYYAGIYASWELDVWGKLKNKKKAALSRFLESEEGKNLVVTNIISEIAASYYRLMILDREFEIISENILLQEKAVNSVSAQKETGKATELGVELIYAQLLNAKGMVIELEQMIIEEENKLNLLLGRYPQQIERSSLLDNMEISKMASVNIPGELLENRPDIKAAAYYLKSQNANVKAAKAAFYPNLTLNGNVGYQTFRSALWFDSPASIAYNVFGSLTTPILNRRALKAELMLSKASHTEAYIQYEKTILNAFTEVYQVVLQADKFEQLKDVKLEQVQTLQKSIGTSQVLFSSGRASYIEMITAQENYLKAQKELLVVYYKKTMNNIQLYKAIGGGWK